MKIAIPDDYQSVAPGGTRLERLDLLIAELDLSRLRQIIRWPRRERLGVRVSRIMGDVITCDGELVANPGPCGDGREPDLSWLRQLTDLIMPSDGFESLSLRQLLPVFSSIWLVAADAEWHIQWQMTTAVPLSYA